jgi:hypothetical protein
VMLMALMIYDHDLSGRLLTLRLSSREYLRTHTSAKISGD